MQQYDIIYTSTRTLGFLSDDDLPLDMLHVYYNNFCDLSAHAVWLMRCVVVRRPPDSIPQEISSHSEMFRRSKSELERARSLLAAVNPV